MVDVERVCCMCGDVGFPDKLFRCNKCRHRFQHSYCSNYYMSEYAEAIEVCDWCQSEGSNKSARSHVSSSKKSMESASSRSEYNGEKIKLQASAVDPTTATDHKGKHPSPRPTARRYKLLKDVMC